MLGDVRERFLRDAVQRRLDLGRRAARPAVPRCAAGGDAGAIRPVLHVVRQRGPQAEIVERGRPQLPDEVIHVAIELLGDRFERFDVRAQVGVVAAGVLEQPDPGASAVSCSPNWSCISRAMRGARLPGRTPVASGSSVRAPFGAAALPSSACFGQVEVGADDAHDRTARLAADRKAAREHVDVVAVLVPQPKLPFVGRLAARRRCRSPAARAGMSSGWSSRSHALMCGSISSSA